MINIDGLTQEQCDMLDVIWSFKTRNDYENWLECLDDYEFNMARSLMELLALAIIDEAQEEMDDPYREASLVIRKIQSKFDTK